MICPWCHSTKTKVTNSRFESRRKRRRRECLGCGERFTTLELTLDEYDQLDAHREKLARIRDAIAHDKT